MTQQTKSVSWGALGVALIAILTAKPELVIGFLTTHAGTLVPFTVAAILAFGTPFRFKHCLPNPKWIPVLSAAVCVFTYTAARALWVLKSGEPYTWADVGFDIFVALAEACLIPVLYDYLPETFRKRWSYTHLKRVRTASGEIVERPVDHPSGDGEQTVTRKQDGHGYPNYLLLLGGLAAIVLGIVSVIPALFWPWLWWVAAVLVVGGVVAILSEIGN